MFTPRLALISAVTFAGQQLAEQLSTLFTYLQVPVFACCFLLGFAACVFRSEAGRSPA